MKERLVLLLIKIKKGYQQHLSGYIKTINKEVDDYIEYIVNTEGIINDAIEIFSLDRLKALPIINSIPIIKSSPIIIFFANIIS
jgi:hypothetical protein